MMLPFLAHGKKRRPRLIRSQKNLIAKAIVFYEYISELIDSEDKILERLKENHRYSEAILNLRLLQWMGLIDIYQSYPPYIKPLEGILIKPLPFLQELRKLKKNIDKKTLSCLAPIGSYILPTPFRTIVKSSLHTNQYTELAYSLIEKENAVTRIIGYSFLSNPDHNTDMIKILLTGYITGIIRPGKKSDPGEKISYIRTQGRGSWKAHPCNQKAPILGTQIIKLEKIIIGVNDTNKGIEWFTKKLPKKRIFALNLFADNMKQQLPEMNRYYNSYYNLEIKPQVNCLEITRD